MLKKFAFVAFAAVPALVFTSCSSPEEAATSSVKDVIEDLTELIEDNKTETLEKIIDELHEFMADVTPDLIDEFEDLTVAERVAVIKNIASSDEGKKLVSTLQTLSTNESIAKLVPAAMMGDMAPVSQIPMDTKMQTVDICANFVKLALAIGLDDEEVQKALREAF